MNGRLSNADQLEYWNGLAGERWAQNQPAIDHAFAAFAAAGIAQLAPTVGERILDVGCGAGGTAIELAQRVGDTGSVTGVDVSGPLLRLARRRAADRQNLSFIEADAATQAFRVAHDAVFSHLGVMFFDDPRRAFDNLRRALTPAGRLAFVCWQRLIDNPWCRIPLDAAAHVLGELPRAGTPVALGPLLLPSRSSWSRLSLRQAFRRLKCGRFMRRSSSVLRSTPSTFCCTSGLPLVSSPSKAGLFEQRYANALHPSRGPSRTRGGSHSTELPGW